MRASELNPQHLDELQAAAMSSPPGALVEVGVFRGGSAARLNAVAQLQGRRLHLFDTFSGIPEATPGVDFHAVGDFGETTLAEVMARVPLAEITVGDARRTLPDTDTGPVALAHIDCDQYETTRAVVRALVPRMVRDGVMVFDDYDVLDGARRAIDEELAAIGVPIEYSAGGKARARF